MGRVRVIIFCQKVINQLFWKEKKKIKIKIKKKKKKIIPLVGPPFTDPLAVKLLDNRLYMLILTYASKSCEKVKKLEKVDFERYPNAG